MILGLTSVTSGDDTDSGSLLQLYKELFTRPSPVSHNTQVYKAPVTRQHHPHTRCCHYPQICQQTLEQGLIIGDGRWWKVVEGGGRS